MNASVDDALFLPVQAAALESGTPERTIYDHIRKGLVPHRRDAEGRIEVDMSKLGTGREGTTSRPSTGALSGSAAPEPAFREKAELEALRLRRELEEEEAELLRARREREMHEERRRHEEILAAQRREFEEQQRLQQAALKQEELRYRAERERRRQRQEATAREAEAEERAFQRKLDELDRLMDESYMNRCAQLERFLVALVGSQRGLADAQRLRAIIRHFIEVYRPTHDFESVQLNAAIAFREI